MVVVVVIAIQKFVGYYRIQRRDLLVCWWWTLRSNTDNTTNAVTNNTETTDICVLCSVQKCSRIRRKWNVLSLKTNVSRCGIKDTLVLRFLRFKYYQNEKKK